MRALVRGWRPGAASPIRLSGSFALPHGAGDPFTAGYSPAPLQGSSIVPARSRMPGAFLVCGDRRNLWLGPERGSCGCGPHSGGCTL